ncbi:MAG: YhjD/YihY/BrkB family envelope integrity protein [Myxococcota bacterium]
MRRLTQALRTLVGREVYLLRLALQIGRTWAHDKCPQQAAALAFLTALSLVPATAVAFWILYATGALAKQSALVDFLSRGVFPGSGERIARQLASFAERVGPGTIGLVGVVGTLLTAYGLFHAVESTWNDIWRVGERRRFLEKFAVFCLLALLGPTVLASSIYYTAGAWRSGGASGFALSLLLSWVGLLLANKLMPRGGVRWRAAAIGAGVSAVLLEAAKAGFSLYASLFLTASSEQIYGALGAVPILLIWIYWAWLVALLGAEIAFTLQNLHLLEKLDSAARRGETLADDLLRDVHGQAAARAMVAVAEAYASGRGPLSREAIGRALALDDESVTRLARRLVERGLLVESATPPGLLPARPIRDITLGEVLAAFRDAAPAGDTPLDRALAVAAEAERSAGMVSFENLVGIGEHKNGPQIDALKHTD